jgi:hypothetical protein
LDGADPRRKECRIEQRLKEGNRGQQGEQGENDDKDRMKMRSEMEVKECKLASKQCLDLDSIKAALPHLDDRSDRAEMS